MSRLSASAAVFVVLLLTACSGDDDGEEIDASTPCDLFTESDASALLGGDVEEISFSELTERESETDIPEADLPLLDAANAKNCVYSLNGSDAAAALQLDRRLFSSVEEYRSAWDDNVEILDSPGLAASFTETDDPKTLGAGVLLNDRGDSFALIAHKADVERSELLDLAVELAERYSD